MKNLNPTRGTGFNIITFAESTHFSETYSRSDYYFSLVPPNGEQTNKTISVRGRLCYTGNNVIIIHHRGKNTINDNGF